MGVHSLNIKGKLISLDQPKVMGIINATPDSFFGGSRKNSIEEILAQAKKMLDEGATFLDIGGYSSRPGADEISLDEELKRVVEPTKAIVSEFPEAIISIDTFRSEVAAKALDAGAHIVNDISAGQLDDRMIAMVGERRVPYIAMHMKGTPQTMKDLNQYENLLVELIYYFSQKRDECLKAGIHDIIIDPGFGFAKNIDQNFEILKNLDHFQHLDLPILVGVSRKSMIYKTLKTTPENALNGTTVLNTFAVQKGVSILRVHDVKEAVETIKLSQKIDSTGV